MEEKKVVNDTASFDGDVAPILPDGWKDGDNLFVDGEDELAKLLADGQETEPSIEPENDDAKPADAASTTGEADAGAVTDAGKPTEQTPPDGETKPEPRTSRKLLLKVNHDEQEVDIDAMSDDELRALLQKGKAFDAMKDAENKRTYRKVYQAQIDAGMTEAAARMIATDAAEGNALRPRPRLPHPLLRLSRHPRRATCAPRWSSFALSIPRSRKCRTRWRRLSRRVFP